jgi:glycosyltransferase involved in cell wall biosynthesis
MSAPPSVFLFADVLGAVGGIETYLDALARRLQADGWPVQVAISANGPAPFLDDLAGIGIPVYRQRPVRGDRWQIRQRLLVRHVARQLKAGDWVYCVRQPMPEIYLSLVRAVHRRQAKIAASWIFAPEFLPAPAGKLGESFRQAVRETDAVISVAHCTAPQFRQVYRYEGPVHVVRYHNIERFERPMPLPASSPLSIGYMGRIDIHQKNLDTILAAFALLAATRGDVVLNIHGGGPDLDRFREMVAATGLRDRVRLHGPYDYRRDLSAIVGQNHLFIYTSRFEGGPCFSLLELLQAGRYVVTSPVGGIPDIYDGRPEVGMMVTQGDPTAIATALSAALDGVSTGSIAPAQIRARYDEEFTMGRAHAQWLEALNRRQVSS